MMDNKIKNTIEYITPTEEQQKRMLRGIKAQMNSRPHRTAAHTLRIAAVAAVLCCLFTITVFAEEIGDFFTGIFTQNEIVGDTVKTEVFTDSDGHVEITVEELLSDMCVVRMVVHYRALDEQGREWLDSLSSDGAIKSCSDEYDFFGFHVAPDFKDDNTQLYGVNCVCSAKEIEEYRADNERFFTVTMNSSDDYWGTANVIFDYTMTDGFRATRLDVLTNIEKRTFILDNSAAPEKLYKPTEVVLSPLSLVIYGENLGFFEMGHYEIDTEIDSGTYYYAHLTEDETIDSLYLVFSDGEKIDVIGENDVIDKSSFMGLGSLNHSAVGDVCSVANMAFSKPIDLDTIAGIELDGVYYPFE